MESAARKKIDPMALLMLCAVALSALTLWVVYLIASGNAAAEQRQRSDRHTCEMTAVLHGESLHTAEVMCS